MVKWFLLSVAALMLLPDGDGEVHGADEEEAAQGEGEQEEGSKDVTQGSS